MKRIFFSNLFLFIFFNFGYTQLGSLVGLGVDLAQRSNSEARKSLASKHVQNDTIDGYHFVKCRIADSKIKGSAKSYILSVQKKLQDNCTDLKNSPVTNLDFFSIELEIDMISKYDYDFDLSFYKAEINFYKKIIQERQFKKEKEIKEYLKLEKIKKDSLAKYLYEEKVRLRTTKDSLANIEAIQKNIENEKSKKILDSIDIFERTDGYYFVKYEKIILFEKPDGKKIGNASKGSYVGIYDFNKFGKYAFVNICGHDGYVLKDQLVKNIDEIPFGVNKINLKKNYYCAYEEIAAPSPSKKEIVYIKVAYNINYGNTYHTGKKGGCYYYSSSGKKVYVDKSYCK